eukprot:GHRQ01018009.1.p2 GENE.GHRQ01018009.1~~GHRQ01018009.1.p2  ORF type:complete len:129 (-),score=23.52 GHRQ01018009.1:913-1299(-)
MQLQNTCCAVSTARRLSVLVFRHRYALARLESSHQPTFEKVLHNKCPEGTAAQQMPRRVTCLLLLAAPLQPHCQLLPLHHSRLLGLAQLCRLVPRKVQLQRCLLPQLLRVAQLLLQLLGLFVCRLKST